MGILSQVNSQLAGRGAGSTVPPDGQYVCAITKWELSTRTKDGNEILFKYGDKSVPAVMVNIELTPDDNPAGSTPQPFRNPELLIIPLVDPAELPEEEGGKKVRIRAEIARSRLVSAINCAMGRQSADVCEDVDGESDQIQELIGAGTYPRVLVALTTETRKDGSGKKDRRLRFEAPVDPN